jgi:hypothetical protein
VRLCAFRNESRRKAKEYEYVEVEIKSDSKTNHFQEYEYVEVEIKSDSKTNNFQSGKPYE